MMGTYKRLTLKELTPAQRERLAAAVRAACDLHGIKDAVDLPEVVRQQITRETMDLFSAENSAAFREAERARTSTPAAPPPKTFTWGANRRR